MIRNTISTLFVILYERGEFLESATTPFHLCCISLKAWTLELYNRLPLKMTNPTQNSNRPWGPRQVTPFPLLSRSFPSVPFLVSSLYPSRPTPPDPSGDLDI